MGNHGVLTVGRTIGEAFWSIWRFQRAAEVQVRSAAMAGPNSVISDEIRRRCVTDADNFGPSSIGEGMFRAMLRKVHRLDPTFES
jgi:hypothetical protein